MIATHVRCFRCEKWSFVHRKTSHCDLLCLYIAISVLGAGNKHQVTMHQDIQGPQPGLILIYSDHLIEKTEPCPGPPEYLPPLEWQSRCPWPARGVMSDATQRAVAKCCPNGGTCPQHIWEFFVLVILLFSYHFSEDHWGRASCHPSVAAPGNKIQIHWASHRSWHAWHFNCLCCQVLSLGAAIISWSQKSWIELCALAWNLRTPQSTLRFDGPKPPNKLHKGDIQHRCLLPAAPALPLQDLDQSASQIVSVLKANHCVPVMSLDSFK